MLPIDLFVLAGTEQDDSFWADPDNPTVNVYQDYRRAGRCPLRRDSRRTFGFSAHFRAQQGTF